MSVKSLIGASLVTRDNFGCYTLGPVGQPVVKSVLIITHTLKWRQSNITGGINERQRVILVTMVIVTMVT